MIESSPNRFGTRQGFTAVTVLANQLTTDFGGTEAGIQTSRGERWVGLALTVHNRLNVDQQVGQTVFDSLPSAQLKGIDTDDVLFDFALAFANQVTVPT